jgi:uncharacterized RDD family membrane protein YckC
VNGEQAPLASLGRRTAAAAIDSLVLSGLVFVLFYDALKVLSEQMQFATTPEEMEQLFLALQTFNHQSLPYIFVIYLAYHTLLVWQSGMTVGKYAVKIRVVHAEDGARVDLIHAFVRALLRTVGELLVLYVTFLPAWFSARYQTLHDRVAATQVVSLAPESTA